VVKKSCAIFPGSFDPLTYGHTDIIGRALHIFDRLVVAVLNHPSKEALFTAAERVALITEEFRSFEGRVEVVSFSGLLVEFARKIDVPVIIRGLRAISDYEYEVQMALTNRNLFKDVETLFMATREEFSFISSSMVKEVVTLGGDVRKFVPARVADALYRKLGPNASGKTE
jgi:pantetheine-phosphate adenylyltransferase